MKHWGMVVTSFYLVVVGTLALLAIDPLLPQVEDAQIWEELVLDAGTWIWLVILIAGPLVLLLTRVRRVAGMLPPQRPKRTAVAAIALAMALLTAAAIASTLAAAFGDDMVDIIPISLMSGIADKLASSAFEGLSYPVYIGLLIIPAWLLWGYVFARHSARILDRDGWVFKWLFRGSVLELLISVPSHVIVQRRDECSAPLFTAYGVSTGIALMFMSFGPGILRLYQARMAIARKKQGEVDTDDV